MNAKLVVARVDFSRGFRFDAKRFVWKVWRNNIVDILDTHIWCKYSAAQISFLKIGYDGKMQESIGVMLLCCVVTNKCVSRFVKGGFLQTDNFTNLSLYS